MNKNILYLVGAVVVGLLAGWLIFGGAANQTTVTDIHDHAGDSQDQMWTCSMHPQIMQPEPGDCPICGMDLIPATIGDEGLSANEIKMTQNAMALANIQTTKIGQATTDGSTIKLSGKVVANEEANSVQVSYFSGRIERLNINFTGEQVNRGQQLATIYSPELYAAQQELITAASLKESQPALYNAVRNKLKLWKLSEAQINQIETSGKVRDNFPVYATVSGTVSEKLVEQGDYVKQGQPLLKIANLSSVWANFDVYENQINLFKKGQVVQVTTNAYPAKVFPAKVDFIDPVLDTRSRTVKLRVVLNNKDDLFKPGMFVEGKIEASRSSKEQAITIPASAVLWTGERSVVYIKSDPDQPVFEMREILLGNRIGDSYEVLEGITTGDEIVTNGTFTVDAAAQLQGKKSMMNKEGGKTTTGHEGHLGMDNKDSDMATSETTMANRMEVSQDFQNQLKQVFDSYIILKDALVSDNAGNVKKEAKNVLGNLSKVDMKLLTNANAHDKWMTVEKSIKTAATSISSSDDIKVQRNHFKQLSTHLGMAVQIFGVNQKVYQQFCPMADNNKGAYWLSLEENVLNPYYGAAMLTCGEVTQIIE